MNYPTTHPPTKPHTHSSVGNYSQISNLQMELKYLDKLKCYRILSDSGVHPPGGVADGWMGMGVGMGVWGVSHACMHTHAHTCMLNMLNMDASMSAAICNFYKCINVRVCMFGGTPPPCPMMPPIHLPPPQSRREPETPKFNKS